MCITFFSKTSKIRIYELKFSNCSKFNILLWFLINLINNDASVSAATAAMCSMVHLVCLFMKTHLLALLQDNCLYLLCCAFLSKLCGCMRDIPYFPANKPTRRISRGQFLALKISFSIFRYLTTSTFFSFCNKVCQVCVTFITHQRMFFIMVEMIPMVEMRARRGREFETASYAKAYGPRTRLRLWEHSERGSEWEHLERGENTPCESTRSAAPPVRALGATAARWLLHATR